MKKDIKSGLPSLEERGMRGEVKDRFGLLLSLGIVIGSIVGVAIENIPAAASMGMIIGLISGLFTKIISNNQYNNHE